MFFSFLLDKLVIVQKYMNPNAHTPIGALNTPIFTFLPQQRNPEGFAKKRRKY
jgi:hypothetical protein